MSEKYGITDAHYLCDSAIFNTETEEILRLYQICDLLNQQDQEIQELKKQLSYQERQTKRFNNEAQNYYGEIQELIKQKEDIKYFHKLEIEQIYSEKNAEIELYNKKLANAIVPKFKVGQEIWEITPLMSWKIKRIECIQFNGGNCDVFMEIYRLGHDGTDDYNCCIMPVDNDRFFATKEEAQAKLEELKGDEND